MAKKWIMVSSMLNDAGQCFNVWISREEDSQWSNMRLSATSQIRKAAIYYIRHNGARFANNHSIRSMVQYNPLMYNLVCEHYGHIE